MSTPIILPSAVVLLEALTWSLSLFKSDINVSIKGYREKLEQRNEIACARQERNASHWTSGGEARDDLSGFVTMKERYTCW
jgi:hypothetical protein